MSELWLTRIKPNTRDRQCRKDLGDPRQLHRSLMRLLPSDLGDHPRSQGSLLYRIEHMPGTTPTILVQTSVEPQISSLADYYPSEVRSLAPMLEAVHEGLIVGYRCVASPIRRSNQTKREIPLKGPEALEWWQTHLDRAGLSSCSEPLLTSQNLVVKDWRTICMTRIDGMAEIRDPKALVRVLSSGIGRNKSWGCGLLTLAPR